LNVIDPIRPKTPAGAIAAHLYGKRFVIQNPATQKPGANVSEGVRESFWLQGMMAGLAAAYFCIKVFFPLCLRATPSRQHALVKMPRFAGAMIQAMKLTILVLIALITLGNSVSMARSHKAQHKPRYGAVITGPQYLSPEAAAMRNAQRSWPNRPLCDDGGYRIRPCDLGGDRR
jgi:hypothetical protein